MPIPRVFVPGLVVVAMLGLSGLASVAHADEYPDTWYWLTDGKRLAEHTKFEGVNMPGLKVGEWSRAPFKNEDVQGKILVIDFWATWCGPCIQAMPHNNKVAEKYAGEGVAVLGVCTSGDPSQMPGILEQQGVSYPNAFVADDSVEKDWPIHWYPTYAVVDRKGIVRAIGLSPEGVEKVVDSLLLEEAKADGYARIMPAWLEGSDESRERLSQLENNRDNPPELDVQGWVNSGPLKLDELEGKVVVLDFWATWSAPCIKSIDRHNKLMQQHGKDKLVIIGVASTLGGEALTKIVSDHSLNYPVCVDVDNRTNTAYAPNGYPDYYLIDQFGRLRIADCSNKSLESAVAALVAETQAGPEAEPDSKAAAETDAADDAADAEGDARGGADVEADADEQDAPEFFDSE